MVKIQLYDTTLRDGMQQEGISFSVADKLKIVQKLDELGIHFIEGGWPGSNPKDTQLFLKARELKLSQSVVCAFGATRRHHIRAADDPNLQALLDARTKVVTLVGKSWDLHVTLLLETSLEENLAMIADSVRYIRVAGLGGHTVFFDAEHFFDGYKSDASYALKTLKAAAGAGAECLILCDTNGGALPAEIARAVEAVRKAVQVPLGIHTHNDGELAVANTLAAVQAGVTQVQGTINGYGERCGNANLCSVIPALQLKMGIQCIPSEQLARLTEVSRYVSEVANLIPHSCQAYTGEKAFLHKAGMHASGFRKWSESYQHIDPTLVGNRSEVVVSELSGVSNIMYKAGELGIELPLDAGQARQILEQIKSLESRGFQYEGAEASFELLIRRAQPGYTPPFELVDFMVVVEKRRRPSLLAVAAGPGVGEELLSEATVKVRVGKQVVHTAAEGNGPVNALDRALRKALVESYPDIRDVQLVDYKVRILEEDVGTESQVRVLIESRDGGEGWRTVGSSTNIIEASWLALADSLEYWLLKRNRKKDTESRQSRDEGISR